MVNGFGLGEHGERVPVEHFDFDRLDDSTQENPQMDAAIEAFQILLNWVWQSGSKNADGVKIRSVLACWIFLKPLRSINLTELSKAYGMEKQSLGRWHDDFKRHFPDIRTPHMRD